MTKPKVSVIVPIYNVEKQLDRCMTSILNQTLKDIEIIMVDDGSPDNCPAMCDEYAKKDSRIKVIHKKNGGLGYARNSGLEIATGEYVAFVDSDDFIDVNMYESLYNKSKEEHLDTCYCSFSRYYDSGKTIPALESSNNIIITNRDDIDKFLLSMQGECRDSIVGMSVWRAIYAMNIINDNNIRFVSEKDVASEDIFFDIDYLSKSKKIGYIPEHYYFYYVNDNSITTNYNKAKYDRMVKMLYLIESKLSTIYDKNLYESYFLYSILRIFKIILKTEVLMANSSNEGIQVLNKRLSEPIFNRMCECIEFRKGLSIYNKLLVYLLNKSSYSLLYLVQKIKRRLK